MKILAQITCSPVDGIKIYVGDADDDMPIAQDSPLILPFSKILRDSFDDLYEGFDAVSDRSTRHKLAQDTLETILELALRQIRNQGLW